MKSKLYLLNLILLFSPIFSFGQTSVMTFNLRYDNPDDSLNQWEYRKRELSQMINKYSPDILGIQEGLVNQVKYLDSSLNGYKYIGVGREDGIDKGEFAAIFYKPQILKLINSHTYWLSETPEVVSIGWDAALNRIVTYGTFVNIKTNDTIHVFNCHLDHIGVIAREKSAELILNIIKEKHISDKKIFVMGDMNSLDKEAPINTFRTQLDDKYKSKDVIKRGPFGTFNSFDSQFKLDQRIDYIFTKNIEVAEYLHIDDKRANNLFISDHFPVLIRIKR